jgi:hypothetical protein
MGPTTTILFAGNLATAHGFVLYGPVIRALGHPAKSVGIPDAWHQSLETTRAEGLTQAGTQRAPRVSGIVGRTGVIKLESSSQRKEIVGMMVVHQEDSILRQDRYHEGRERRDQTHREEV